MASLKRLGPYVFEQELGSGALGTVYLGTQSGVTTPVAVKVLSQQVWPEQDLAKLFQRDAQPAYALRHRNIIEMLEVSYDEGKHYLVMEYMPAGDLQTRLDAGNYPHWRESVRLIIQVLNALQYAHDNLVLHCDVKPANILLDAEGQAILTGFGMYYISDEEVEHTPEFMAPELVVRDQVDGRVDTYSAALVLYELLTQTNPLRGKGTSAIPRPDKVNPEIAPELAELIMRGLARHREDRPTAGWLSRQLGEFMSSREVTEVQPEPEPEPRQIKELAVPDLLVSEPNPDPVTAVMCSWPPEQEAKKALDLQFHKAEAANIEWLDDGLVALFVRPLQAIECATTALESFSLDQISVAIVTGVFKPDAIWAETRPDLGGLACRNMDRLNSMLVACPKGKLRMCTVTAGSAPSSLALDPVGEGTMQMAEAAPEVAEPILPPPTLEQRLGPASAMRRPSFAEPIPSALRGQSRTMEVPKPQKPPTNWNNIISLFLIIGFSVGGYYLWDSRQPGNLIVVSTPSQVSVSLDSEKSRPYKPGTAISLSPGEHKLKVTAKGFAPFLGKVTIVSKNTNKFQVQLKKPAKPQK